jgi:propionyl-CoA carboxylase alpha chain
VLAATLRRAEVDGLATNRDFLVRLLEDRDFLAGDFDTGFLERPASGALVEPLLAVDDVRACAAAAALASQAARRAAAGVQASIPSGWRNNPSMDQLVEYVHDDATLTVGYRFSNRELVSLHVDSEPFHGARVESVAPDGVELEVGGVRRRFAVRVHGADVHVSCGAGQCDLRELDRYPDPSEQLAAGSLVAPMPGTVVRVDAAEGATVQAGDPLLVLEAMKMEHEIVAPASGVLTALPVAVGQQVAAGALLAAIEETIDDGA